MARLLLHPNENHRLKSKKSIIFGFNKTIHYFQHLVQNLLYLQNRLYQPQGTSTNIFSCLSFSQCLFWLHFTLAWKWWKTLAWDKFFQFAKIPPHYEKLIYETLLPVVSHLAKLYKLWKGDFKPKQKELWDIFVIFLMHRKTIKRREMSYEKNLNIFIHHSHCGKIRIFCNFCTKIQIIFLASFHHKKNF